MIRLDMAGWSIPAAVRDRSPDDNLFARHCIGRVAAEDALRLTAMIGGR